jgi:hypothetical protein
MACKSLLHTPNASPPAFQLQIYSLNSQAAAFVSHGNCSAAMDLEKAITHNTENGFISIAAQSLGESAALVAIILAFACSAVLCARRFDASQLSLSSAHLKLQILATSAIVFATFLLRVAFAALNTYALFYAIEEEERSSSSNSSCTQPCAACHSQPYVINRFLFFCPELRAAVVLLSSPATLLVACWGMTSQGAFTPPPLPSLKPFSTTTPCKYNPKPLMFPQPPGTS